MTANLSGNAQIFTPSIVPDEVFPLPVSPCSIPVGAPHTPIGGWYGDRFRGTCGYAPGDFNRDGTQDNLKVWGFNYDQISGLGGGIAFELTTMGSTAPFHSGFLSFPTSDRSQLQVAFTYAATSNAGAWVDYFDVWAVFYNPSPAPTGGYYLERYQLDPNPSSPTAGLTLLSSTQLSGNLVSSTISLTADAFNRNLLIAWEEPSGIHLKALSSEYGVGLGGVYKTGPSFLIPGSAGCKFPDAATEDANWGPGGFTGGEMIHAVFLNPVTKQIIKGKVGYPDVINAGGLVWGSFTSIQPWVVDDIENLSNYNPALDGFQLQIALRRESYTFGNIPWAYTYYNDDGNKINLRYQPYDKPSDPPRSPRTLVLNDGSLGNGDISMAANAFPTIVYTGPKISTIATNYHEILVGWYTTYDPTMPAGANPLYTYSSDSKRYVAIKVSEDPAFGTNPVTTGYMEISDNYNNNYAGQAIGLGYNSYWNGYPFISFATQSDTNPVGGVFCTFAGHGLMDAHNTTGPYIGNKYSFPVKDAPLLSTGIIETNYISNKVIVDINSKSSFKTTNSKYSSNQAEATSLDLHQNIFTAYNRFRLVESGNALHYKTNLTSLYGQHLNSWNGTISEINRQIESTDLENLAAGIYMLNTINSFGERKTFKIIKQ